MLFFIFSAETFSNPIIPITITKNKSCAPILYTLLDDCHIMGEQYPKTASAFIWKDSLWTTHSNIAGASFIYSGKEKTNIAIIEKNPLVDYAQLAYVHSENNLDTTNSFRSGEPIICVGVDADGYPKKTTGYIQNTNISITYNRNKSPPLLEITCPIEDSMTGGILLNEQERLIGMLMTTQSGFTYAIAHDRLRASSHEIGLSIQNDHVVYSVHTEIPVGTEIFGFLRNGKSDNPPFRQLLEDERIRIQLHHDDVWLQPVSPKHNTIMLLEDNEGEQHVIRPSALWFEMGIRANDRWFAKQKNTIIRIKRDEKILYVLNPDWWRDKNKK